MTTYAEDALEYAQLMGRLLKTYRFNSDPLIEVTELTPQNMAMAWQVYEHAQREGWVGSPLGRFCADLPEVWEHVAYNSARPEDHQYLKESLADLRKTLRVPEPEAPALKNWTISGVAEVRFEDAKQACIAEIHGDPDADDGVFVRFQSWIGGGGEHPNAHLAGKRVRVEITVLDE